MQTFGGGGGSAVSCYRADIQGMKAAVQDRKSNGL